MAEALAVYVHWPFCLAKCPYCDFNSHVAEAVDQDRWRAAYLAEIAETAARTPGRKVTSIFFGGGTPSLMPPETVAAIIGQIDECWQLARDAEITLEANPSSVEAARLADVAAAGANRLSLGVQALDDAALAFLGRLHTVEEALAAVQAANTLFDRISIDLIYGRPGQTVADWSAELTAALNHAGGHISAYQLTIEKGTPFFGAERDGVFALPDEAVQAELYSRTAETLAAAGYEAYEISNYARPGEACRHNLHVWRYGDYAGIGPGAHGRLTVDGMTCASEAIPGPTGWLDAAEIKGHGRRRLELLSAKAVAEEMLLTGLRIADGVSAEAIRQRTGRELAAWIDSDAARQLSDGGLSVLDTAGIRLT
ncbi:MAG: radical SAM family heme chaperone HemW, partial [Alphaproteobacteria bacterium]|nr:radical SAM family heme chaperone HemW [Alphaproteobacteria bacterium]